MDLAGLITDEINQTVAQASGETGYRTPLVAFVQASDPRFAELQQHVDRTHRLPQDLLPGAETVVSFFLPFAPEIVQANSRDRRLVPREWAVAYVETNNLIQTVAKHLIAALAEKGIRAVAEAPTHNFDPVKLVSRWSHKSVAVIAGLGSFGQHHQVITDAGCAGRFGSLVLDALIPSTGAKPKERCLYFHDGSCLECVTACPVAALDESSTIDKQACYTYLKTIANEYIELNGPEICGKCSTGPCAIESAV
ncbi:MAG: epoxyqueuosine reductase [Anaerolineales bacterium]|nr:epoxyqueuosine reductase [Anaerolineales bacterium]